jgi:hypothetical protein
VLQETVGLALRSYLNYKDMDSTPILLHNYERKGLKMFDPSAGDALVMLLIGAVYFHLGRTVGLRVGYLKGRKAVQTYYDKKERVKV